MNTVLGRQRQEFQASQGVLHSDTVPQKNMHIKKKKNKKTLVGLGLILVSNFVPENSFLNC